MRQTFLKGVIFAIAFISTTFLSLVGYAAWTSLTSTVPTQQNNDTLNASIWNNLVAKVNSLIDNTNDLDNRISTFPVFSVYSNIASSAPISVWVKVPFNVIDFDPTSSFNTTNNRFQPTKAGYYHISLSIRFSRTGAGGSTSYIGLFKNGLQYKMGSNLQYRTSSFDQTLNLDTDIYMNGTTDYLEGDYNWNGGTVTLIQGLSNTRMSGYYLRP